MKNSSDIHLNFLLIPFTFIILCRLYVLVKCIINPMQQERFIKIIFLQKPIYLVSLSFPVQNEKKEQCMKIRHELLWLKKIRRISSTVPITCWIPHVALENEINWARRKSSTLIIQNIHLLTFNICITHVLPTTTLTWCLQVYFVKVAA